MHAQSPKDRSRSPHRTNGTAASSQSQSTPKKHAAAAAHADEPSTVKTESGAHESSARTKKDLDTQLRLKSLKTFIQAFVSEASSSASTHDEQVKALENACTKEFHDLSPDRIRRMIRSVSKLRKSHPSSSHLHASNSFIHQDSANSLPTGTDRFGSGERTKKNRSNSTSNNATPKTSDLIPPSTSTISALDADFLRQAFSQQFRPSLDLSSYFSAAAAAAAASNGTGATSPLFRPNFSPSNFLQTLTAPPPPPPPPPALPSALVSSSHAHTNGTTESTGNVSKSSKSTKLSNNETSSIKVLVNAYREAASYLCRSADELEQLI